MKVLEAQSAVLSNYEVHEHLMEQRKRYKKVQRRGPPNHENVVKELLGWFHDPRNPPLNRKPVPYKPESIATLLERVRPFDLSKGEVVMILNIRPWSLPGLNSVVDDMAERLTEDQQMELLTIIADVLGKYTPPPAKAAPADGQGAGGGENGADVTMGNSAA